MLVLLGTLCAALLFTIIFRNSIKRFPAVFYLLAIALNIFVLFFDAASLPRAVQIVVFYPMQRCYLALAFFAIVMFIGVLSNNSRARVYLLPIRAELSILACLLALAHIVRLISNYVPKLIGATSVTPVYVSVALALVLTALLALLGVTSFSAVRKKMSAATWKKIQRLAYPFFLLIYVHVGLIFLPSLLSGGIAALESFLLYSIIFISYSVLRIRKELIDRSARALPSNT